MDKQRLLSKKNIFIFFLFCVFHFRIYYYLGISVPIYVELVIVGIVFWIVKNSNEEYKEEPIIYYFFTFFFVFAYYVLGLAIENSLFYKQVAKEYDMVYSSELVYCSSTQKWGIQGRLQLLDDTTGTTYFVGNNYDFPNAFDLFAYPKLAYADYPGFFSIYHKRLLDNEPTSLQLAYCRNGERLSDKILNLKKNVNAVSKEDILNYILHFRQHDNRIVSAVVEKRHFVSCFMFANVLQSDDKLWALKYRDVEEGKKVLIIYDISSPHLFFVIDWNPSDEDYEYYNTKEGKNPTFKYLLKLEHLSTKLQPSNDEEELMVDD